MRRILKRSSGPLALIALLALVLAGIGASSGGTTRGPEHAPGLAKAIGIQETHTDRLLGIRGVVGTAVSEQDGKWVVKVYTDARGVRGVPKKLDGTDVVVQITGKLRALHHRPGHSGGPGGPGGSEPPPPPPPPPSDGIPNGSSTGNANECSAGTLGAKVLAADGTVLGLSNNHVWARENHASIGEKILHPGLFDTSCVYDPANRIGSLDAFVPIDFAGDNLVDAAIAEIDGGVTLSGATPQDGYGSPKSTVVEAVVGQDVQKYGRSSDLTKGTITGINAQVLVGYDGGTALFVDQIIVEAKKPLIKAGDSGSLLVADPSRESVGLLFAGNKSGKFAIANEIDNVLTALGVTIAGD